MRVVAACDWMIDMGPGAGQEGGRVVATGTPALGTTKATGPTAPYLARVMRRRPSSASDEAFRPSSALPTATGGDDREAKVRAQNEPHELGNTARHSELAKAPLDLETCRGAFRLRERLRLQAQARTRHPICCGVLRLETYGPS